MNPTPIELLATVLFALAVVHTFMVKKFEEISHKYPAGSIGENAFHFLGEVEAVFGMWAAVLVLSIMAYSGGGAGVEFLEGLNFTEPAFVFVIMAMAGTRPVIKFAETFIIACSKIFPYDEKRSFFMSALIFGPLLGSFITEPAAMTVTALILQKNFYSKSDMSMKFKYATLGLLFVNISIGGTLSHFAAPPVLMVASKWGWGFSHMFMHFGYKAAIAIFICTFVVSTIYKKELVGQFLLREETGEKMHPRWWITLTHIVFLALVVLTAHHMVVFFGIFLFFLGFTTVTQEYQDAVKLKESLLVGFFLGGLVILGSLQAWWLKPVLSSLGNVPLYLGATGLTGLTDNAALTYLGSLVDLSDAKKYYLVAGAVTGGGLTVIANAPNPAGFGILKQNFGEDGISPLGLLKAALFPTLVALLAFYFLGPKF
jgi:Na+/H+ antiporter NhaD/arsenite permease-like protein